MAFAARSLTPAELAMLVDAERRGEPFLAWRDGGGGLRVLFFDGRERVAIGRIDGNDVVLEWDRQVSRSHAELQRVGADWTLVDDGLSRNGSHVNGERVVSRRRLSDGDVVRVGETTLVFRAPVGGHESTLVAAGGPIVPLTAAERRVLVALCGPFATDGGPAPSPATNREIADELKLSLDGVKTHVKALFVKLGVGELPQYQKRTELARRALEQGLVTREDLVNRTRER